MAIPVVIVEWKIISEERLKALIEEVSHLSMAKITVNVRSTWAAIHCDNYQVLMALKAILDCAAPPAPGKKPNKADRTVNVRVSKGGMDVLKNREQPKAHPAPTLKSWHLLDADGNVLEKLSIDERNLRMANGGFAEGAILQHPKVGKQRIIGSGHGQGMEPV